MDPIVVFEFAKTLGAVLPFVVVVSIAAMSFPRRWSARAIVSILVAWAGSVV
jgi:hypothetical protein